MSVENLNEGEGKSAVGAELDRQFAEGLLTKEQQALINSVSDASAEAYLSMNIERHELLGFLVSRDVILAGEADDLAKMDPFDAMKDLITLKRDFDRNNFMAENQRSRGIEDDIA